MVNGFGLLSGKYKKYSNINSVLDDWFNISNIRCGVYLWYFNTYPFVNKYYFFWERGEDVYNIN